MSANDSMRQDRDLVLPPNTYAFVLDQTKGNVSAYVGPRSGTLSPTDRLVTWTGKRFSQTSDFSQAIQPFVKAAEGQYIILTDPAASDAEAFPAEAQINSSTQLDAGKRIVIPGPATFALWPGQAAQVLDGHTLNLNQYLIAQVYQPDAAQENMERQIAAPSAGEGETSAVTAREFTMGERIVIRGSDVSFYVPPTGIEVLPERPDGKARYVREAATLEQLEYCVLVDENGNKRYERGPAVIFPRPTETFVSEKGTRKFRAIELNPQSALYIKVIAPYSEDGNDHNEGEELFLTGEDMPIYFPRPEHSVIHYGDQRKHHAVAVPAGEGRYVLDRESGEVSLVDGPRMFLPDPRKEVVVRRVLDAREVTLMYPGNLEAAQVNEAWKSELIENAADFLPVDRASVGESGALARSYATTASFAGDKMRRSTTYTPPRTITLDTKYQGAVGISIWPGYAVLVMDKTGNRRVVVGPKNVLLAYDESLMALTFSTGRPKSDANRLSTVYLRTVNNAISDQITVETQDLVPVTVDLSLRVNFEGEDPTKWFDVEDYVALLTDHCRSRLRNAAKHYEIREFYTSTIDIIRDALLGEAKEDGRVGLVFEENGMHLYDVEVLRVKIEHPSVEVLLARAMNESLEGTIHLQQAEQQAERDSRLQELTRERIDETELTRQREGKAALASLEREVSLMIARVEGQHQEAQERQDLALLQRGEFQADADQALAIRMAQDEADLARMREEVNQFVTRVGAVDPTMVQALQQFGDQTFVEKLVEALGPAAMATGVTSVDLLHQAFKGTPFEGITQTLSERPFALAAGKNGAETP